MTSKLTLRAALRTRVDQWHLPDRRHITDRALDDAIGAAIPRELLGVLAHHSPIATRDIDTISRAILLDHEGFDDESDPFWVVHDSSGRTESDVTWGVAYVIGRVLTLAESRLLDQDAHRFPRLREMRATTDPDVREWLDECVRGGTIPASALTRFPAILSLTERDIFRLMTLAQPLDDRGWTADDLAQYARGFLHRRPACIDALVRTTVEAVGEASWTVAVETIQRIRTAADGLPWHDARS